MKTKIVDPYSHKSIIRLAAITSLLINIVFVLGFTYARANLPAPPGVNEKLGLPYTSFFAGFISNFLLAYILYALNFKLIKFKSTKKALNLFVIIFTTFVCTLILSYVLSNIHLMMRLREVHHLERFYYGNFGRDSFIALIVVFTAQLIYLRDKQQKTTFENQKLFAENIQARYESLKNQVNPHFLFNSLNTLNTLIGINDDKAKEYVQQLSSVFRYSLQNKEIILLKEEMNFVNSYIHLMKIRYGNNLQVKCKIAEVYNYYYIMPITVQVLVENAIKHNIISDKIPLTIHIETTDKDTIKVYNIIQAKKDADDGAGIGLANLMERYKLLLQKEITITNTNDVFSVEIPLIDQVKSIKG